MTATALYRRKPRAPTDDRTEPPCGPRPAFGSREGLLGRHLRVSAGQVSEAIGATEAAAGRTVSAVVMGPTGVVRGPTDRLVCATLNRSLVRASRTHGFEFVDVLRGWDRAFCLPDGMHLTAEGHRPVADRLFATIGPRVASWREPISQT